MADISFTHFPLWAATFIVFNILYYIVSPRLCERFVMGYSKLSESTKIEWHTMTVSNVHTAIIVPLSLYVLLNDEAINQDKVWGNSYQSQIPIAITTGFITSDFFILLFKFPLKGSRSFLLHHVFTAVPFIVNLMFGPLTFFAVFRILAETSTPFVNQRWFYDVLDMKSTKGYMINGLILMFTFFISRILTMPMYYYAILGVVTSPVVQTLAWLHLVTWIGGSIGLDVLNCIWFRKIVRGALKIVMAHTSKAEEASADSLRNRVKGE